MGTGSELWDSAKPYNHAILGRDMNVMCRNR